MRIRISFSEAGNYTFENPENFISNIFTGKKIGIHSKLDEIGKQLMDIIHEDYFNGADSAVSYIGYSLEYEYYEFDLIPNI